jgi:hypothetical protein
VADDHDALAGEPRDHVVEIGDVVEVVVVAARADPVAVAVAAQIGRDDVRVEQRRDLVPAIREIEKAVDEDVGRVARRIPLEDVVGEPGGELEAVRVQGPASMWKTPPPVVVR